MILVGMLALLWGHWDLGLLVWSDSIKSSNNFRTDFPLKMPLKKFFLAATWSCAGKCPFCCYLVELSLSIRVEESGELG
jgi:hypothetical protein